jgi:hypothetical protein
MLASDLTPAVKLLLYVAAEGMTARGDVPFDQEALARRLGVAKRTLRDRIDRAQAAGWLSGEPTIRPCRGRPVHYGAKLADGGGATATVHRAQWRQNRGQFAAALPPLSGVDGGGATATVNRDESDDGGGATATVPIETPDQDDPMATGAYHVHGSDEELSDIGAPAPAASPTTTEIDLSSSSVRAERSEAEGGPGGGGPPPAHDGAAAAAPEPSADLVASEVDHRSARESARKSNTAENPAPPADPFAARYPDRWRKSHCKRGDHHLCSPEDKCAAKGSAA